MTTEGRPGTAGSGAPRKMLERATLYRLDVACAPLKEAFGHRAYLVGSATERPDYRDLDVRLMLPDEEYDAHPDEFWAFVGLAVTEWLRASTSLPVDFQFQRLTDANERHPKPRNPLGLRKLTQMVGDQR